MIVGLSGKMRAGKSVTAKALAEKHGFVNLSFATYLKEDVVAMGFDPEDVYHRKPPWMRALLQSYGQARRAQDPDYWLKKLEASVAMCKPTTIFIVDDVRFPNEATYIEQMGTLIRLERDGYNNVDTDLSETALDDWPFDHTVYSEEGPEGVIDLILHTEDILWADGVIE